MNQKGKQTNTTNHIAYVILVLKISYTCIMYTMLISFILLCDVHSKAKTLGFSFDEVFKLSFNN